MKKHVLTFLAILVSSSAFALDDLVVPTYATNPGQFYGNNSAYSWFDEVAPNSFVIRYAHTWGDITAPIVVTTGDSSWFYPVQATTNITQSGGTTSIMRGSAEPTAHFTINHKLTGRIYARANGGTASPAPISTTIVGDDDPDVSSITGKLVGARPTWAGRNDNALTIIQGNSATPLGLYHLIEGNFIGGDGFSGGVFASRDGLTVGSLQIEGTSFLAGKYTTSYSSALWANADEGNNSLDFAASGLNVALASSLSISNHSTKASDRFQGADIGHVNENRDAVSDQGYFIRGGDGLTASSAGTVTIDGGQFIGSQQLDGTSRTINMTAYNTSGATASAYGGSGAFITGSSTVNILDSRFIGGQAGNTTVGGPSATAESMGGHGLLLSGASSAGNVISNSYFWAGSAGEAITQRGDVLDVSTLKNDNTDSNGVANAMGGHGINLINSTVTIDDVESYATHGGRATASTSAEASGGAGLFANDSTVTINSGTFVGADGGSANGDGIVNAYGGAGAYVSGGTLTINGGTFSGGRGGFVNGSRSMGDIAVWASDSNLTIAEATNSAPTTINGDVIFNTTGGDSLAIAGGTITGDILKYGEGTAAVNVSTNASYSGSFSILEGNVDVALSNEVEGLFFSQVYIADGSTNNFNISKFVSKTGSSFTLGGSNSVLSFAQGADLSAGSSINAGFGTVNSSAGNLTLGENSSVSLSYNGLSGVSGMVNLTGGSLIMTNTSARLNINGAASTSAGSATFVTGGASSLATNANVQADLGWMVNEIVDTSAGVKVDWTYNSLTNSSLSDLDHSLLVAVDDILTSTNVTSSQFFALNSAGEDGGTQMFRYSLSQLPDVSESSFQVSQQVNQQLAARGTEFRSMNGFASSKPSFGKAVQPVGAAGPDGEDQTMQGWVRAYGSFGNRDKTDNFAAYDSSSWGTVVGVDKSFGKLLVGLAGGYARTDLDAGDAYEANVDTYYGSLYSTIGGERIFLDLAATYGLAKTKENNQLMDESNFDSDILSFYIGGGMSFDVKETLSITPELSLLTSYYNQEAYNRTTILGTGSVQEYDTSSYLGSLGVNFATQHQMDWLNQGLAFIPEVRAHWLHEFNPDPDSFFYSIGGVGGPSAVRPRDEDLLRIGVGFDLWNWKYQSTKFELDYDGLFSSTYAEHIFSGKITLKF